MGADGAAQPPSSLMAISTWWKDVWCTIEEKMTSFTRDAYTCGSTRTRGGSGVLGKRGLDWSAREGSAGVRGSGAEGRCGGAPPGPGGRRGGER